VSIVIDASVTLAWCFKDELTAAVSRLLERLQTETARVPSLWPLEVANVLGMAERRGRITSAESTQLIDLLKTLDIVLDHETPTHAFDRILDIARAQRLTTYDAAYVELAMRLGLPLASKDMQLCDAAERVGVIVLRAA
jgi:predicted nucleic acid-binding protein